MSSFPIIDIRIYPIKSLGGISLDSSEVTELGLHLDRRWMLVDDSNRFLSQREIPHMALFKCCLIPQGIEVSYNSEKIEIPFEGYKEEDSQVTIWDHDVIANEVDTSISKWFSDHLNLNSKLVTAGKNFKRTKLFTKPPFKTKVSFADGYPFLFLGSASLELLNSKLSEPLPFDRFRPNIIVNTNLAHEEESWNKIEIGSAQFKIINACARCIIPTIDQSTGMKDKEPLKTLNTYRKSANKILFGANAMMVKEGLISKSDLLVVH